MKFINMSLAAMIAMSSTSLFASESLTEALTTGKFSGEVRFLHTQGNNSDVKAMGAHRNAKDASAAIEVSYVTADFKGFKAGISAQSGWDLSLHDKDGSSEDDTRNTITGTEIQELYLEYAFNESSIKVGRQELKTPLLNNSYAFPMRDSFDAAKFTTKLIPDTLVKLMYIDKWNKRYGEDSDGGETQEDFEYDDGLYSMYVKNNSIENLTIDTQYMTTNEEDNNGDPAVKTEDGYDQYFVRTNYKLPTAHPMSVGLLYAGASFDKVNEDDANVYGVKFGTKLAGINLSAAYTTTDEENDYPGTLGHVPDTLVYTNGLLNKAFYAGTDAYMLQGAYKFTDKLNTRLKLIHLDQSDKGMSNSIKQMGEVNEVNLDVKYDLSSILKGLSTRAFVGFAEHDDYVKANNGDGAESTYGRFYLTYKF